MNANYTTAIHLIDEGEKEPMRSRYAQVLAKPVARALRAFAEDSEFADAVVARGKTGFGGCLATVIESIGSSISDIEVYRRAANFYFPGCGVRFRMEIDLTAGACGRADLLPGGENVKPEPELQPTGNEPVDQTADTTPKKISIDLDDLFD